MSNNFIKFSSYVKDDEVRIIKSNELAAKYLDEPAAGEYEEPDGDEDSFLEGLAIADTADLSEYEDNIISAPADDEIIPEKKDNKVDIQAVTSQASDIVAKAKEEAERILSQANDKAKEIQKKAYDEGYEEGIAQGIEAGRCQMANEEERLKEKEKELDLDYARKVEEIEPYLVDKITDIYTHIFNVDLSEHKQVLMHLIKSTLFDFESNKEFVIKVSKEDYPALSMKKKDILSGTGISSDNVEIVEDHSVARSSCIIETDGGIFDCGINTQLDNVAKELAILSYRTD